MLQLVEAGEQQSGDDQQRRRDRELRRHQRAAQAPDADTAVDDRLDRSDSSTLPPVAFNAGTRPNSNALDIASASISQASAASKRISPCAGK